MAARYGKDVMVVEVGGEGSQPQNTYDMLVSVQRKVRAVPHGNGRASSTGNRKAPAAGVNTSSAHGVTTAGLPRRWMPSWPNEREAEKPGSGEAGVRSGITPTGRQAYFRYTPLRTK